MNPPAGVPHAPADNVRVKVVDAVGTTPDTVADDFDYYDAVEPYVVEQTATLDCGPYVERVRVRVKVSQPVKAGQPLSLAVGATYLFDEAFMSELVAPGAEALSMGIQAPPIGVTGTTKDSVSHPLTGSLGLRDTAFPLAFDFPRSGPLDPGIINADASTVVLTIQPTSFNLRGFGFSPVGGLRWDTNEIITCTPRSTTLATIPVSGDEEPTTVTRNFGVAGVAALRSLTKGSFPLKGTLDTQITTATGAISGNLKLESTTANLIAFGFLPVSARLAFVSTEPTTGSLIGGRWSTTSKVRIKVTSVWMFGIPIPDATIPGCHARQITSIALKSTAPAFDPAVGGNVAGAFTISDLAGCRILNGLVSPLTAGKSNLISLNLTPRA